MSKDWEKWCRLCGKMNGSDVDVTMKLKYNDETLIVAIMKYFRVLIIKDKSCVKICFVCNERINSIIKYNAYILRVNEMFLELQNNLNQYHDLTVLREKYDLNCYNKSSQNILSPEFCTEQIDDTINESGKTNLHSKYNESSVKMEDVAEDVGKIKDNKNDNLHLEQCPSKSYAFEPELSFISSDKNIISKKFLECNICKKKFVGSRGVTIHMKQKHCVKFSSPPFKCKVCERLFKRKHHLKVHEGVHMSENDRILYDCSQCAKKFTKEWYVQHHIRVVHMRDRSFICELCGAAFGTNRNLVDHHLTHSEEKKFKCPKCEKTFKCKRALKLHVDSHDDTEYVCQVCGLKLNTKQILRRHMLVHSDQKKYRCNFCSKQFKRTDAFKNHLILHTGLKPYECYFCELTFANGSNCRTHQKTVHPVELAAAELEGQLKLSKNVPSIKQLKAVNEEALIEKKNSKEIDI